ncbi:MAG: hypothetical protein R3C05_25360 [Pirellulaceae bacterium]
MFPTSGNRMVAIGIRDGRELGSQRVNYPLGNLVSVRGQMLSQSSTHLAMARGRETAAENVKQALLADPDSIWATICKAELAIEADDRDQAIALLTAVRERGLKMKKRVSCWSTRSVVPCGKTSPKIKTR